VRELIRTDTLMRKDYFGIYGESYGERHMRPRQTAEELSILQPTYARWGGIGYHHIPKSFLNAERASAGLFWFNEGVSSIDSLRKL
jgi:hypothetical protein